MRGPVDGRPGRLAARGDASGPARRRPAAGCASRRRRAPSRSRSRSTPRPARRCEAKHRLELTVAVALTPPGGTTADEDARRRRLALRECAAWSSCSPPGSLLSACGETPRPATEPRVKLKLDAPDSGGTTRDDHVAVRGTVTPADAAVQVDGRGRRRSAAGEFTADVEAPAGRQRDRHHRHVAGPPARRPTPCASCATCASTCPTSLGKTPDDATAALEDAGLVAVVEDERQLARPAARRPAGLRDRPAGRDRGRQGHEGDAARPRATVG